MSYYLYSGQKAAIKGFRTGDWTESDRIHEHNEGVLRDLFGQLVSGKIKVFYTRYKAKDTRGTGDVWINQTVWHRSTRPGVLVQESHMWIKNGEILPCSHQDLNSFEDLLEHQGFTTGQHYKTVA